MHKEKSLKITVLPLLRKSKRYYIYKAISLPIAIIHYSNPSLVKKRILLVSLLLVLRAFRIKALSCVLSFSTVSGSQNRYHRNKTTTMTIPGCLLSITPIFFC